LPENVKKTSVAGTGGSRLQEKQHLPRPLRTPCQIKTVAGNAGR